MLRHGLQVGLIFKYPKTDAGNLVQTRCKLRMELTLQLADHFE